MSLLNKNEIQKRVNAPFLNNPVTFEMVSQILGWKNANQFYDRTKNYNVYHFLNAYKIQSKIEHSFNPTGLQKIPKSESLIVVANHPTGIPDGLLILDTLLSVRSDVKIVANDFTYKVDPIKPYTFAVDPYNESDSAAKNSGQIRQILQWLNDGHCIILFPSGDVSGKNRLTKQIEEQPWNNTAKKILLKHKGTIIPWAISGNNSNLFYQFANIHPALKSALLPREGMNRRKRPIFSQIGQPLKLNGSLDALSDLEIKIRLMSKVNGKSPRSPFQNIREKWRKNHKIMPLTPIIDPINSELIKAEIQSLDSPISQKGDLEVFAFSAQNCPNLMMEIGRLRERTFREVNEGTNLPYDIDSHDQHFTQLVLWDKQLNQVAGGYRMGFKQSAILLEHYHPNQEMKQLLNQSVVLGRAFVVKEYQAKPFPLFLLWQAIENILQKRSDVQYIVGQTSLPGTFHEISKQLIVSYIEKNHSAHNFKTHFKAIHPFQSIDNTLIKSWIHQSSINDFKRLDSFISNIEPNGAKIPILFKRYIDQGAKFIGVNVDPNFNDSLDILMLTPIHKITIPKCG